MIVSKTPLRISFLGGGTDYPEHYSLHGGATLVTAIDKFSYINLNPLRGWHDYRFRISYRKTELVNRLDDIEHPAVRESLRFMGLEGELDIHYIGDLPARSGLGSSSSFTVCLLHALHAYLGRQVTREQLAAEAIHVERDMIRERVGCQDQYACALGGFLHVRFHPDRPPVAEPVVAHPGRLAELQQRLMLFDTRIRRNAHEVLDEQLQNTQSGRSSDSLRSMASLVDEGMEVLVGRRPLATFGELLHTAWDIKRGLSSRVSLPSIDEWYDRARRTGAVGGKLLGAGGGGFLLLYAEPDRQRAVEGALPDLLRVPFAFEPEGSSIIFYRP